MAEAVIRPFPRAPLFGAAALVCFTILAAGTVHMIGTPSQHHDSGPKIASRDLRFEDGANGSVDVYNLKSGALIDSLPPGTNGFVRATLRGMATERRLESRQSSAVPFRLTAWVDGRITLDDLSTGRHVELEAFGPTNAGAFAGILKKAVQ